MIEYKVQIGFFLNAKFLKILKRNGADKRVMLQNQILVSEIS